ncbi:MAG: sugar lactone lactonase YvrE [Halieaceae bacterium]|jgi:sugar lactone lactonase YvrE
MFRVTLLSLAALMLCACSIGMTPITDCEVRGDIRPVCNMKTPEDIAALPDGRHLLLAHFGHMGKEPGSISLFDTSTDELISLFPVGADSEGPTDWGDAACTTPPNETFGPHGTHLAQLEDGSWRYLVVNHGAREAVEIFELTHSQEQYTLSWRGCVMAAAETLMNDVVGLTNGDVVYSKMYSGAGMISDIKTLLGFSSGELWHWNSQTGLKSLPATRASMPNGLEISADNRYVFANMYMEGEVWKVDLDSGEVVAKAPIAHADNSAWGGDGRLYIATHTGGLAETLICFGNQSVPCGGAFEIVALDPETMSSEVAFAHRGAPMGVATIAVPQAGRVWMGSYAGDRLISVSDFTRNNNQINSGE